MKSKFFIIYAICFIIILTACECRTCKRQGFSIKVPDSIFKSAGEYISTKTGNEFFKSNFYPDFIRSKKVNEIYEVHYNFRMLDYEFVDNDVILFLTKEGKITKENESIGIPDCVNDINDCQFDINRAEAVEIAYENGITDGIKEILSRFEWDNNISNYVWHIMDVLDEQGNPKTENYKANGKEIFINPHSGEVISIRDWKID